MHFKAPGEVSLDVNPALGIHGTGGVETSEKDVATASDAVSLRASPPLPRTVWEWADWCAARTREGKVMGEIARAAGRSRPYVRRCLWLSTWPADLRNEAEQRPALFTPRVLIGTFATSMACYEAKGWQLLKAEITRMSEKGVGAVPRKRRGTRLKRQGAVAQEAEVREDKRGTTLRSQMLAEARLREMLMTQVKVDSEWIRIRYFGAADLERLTDGMPTKND